MIAVDSNILVYAHRSDSRFHGAAVDALASLSTGNAPWALPWPCIHEFLSVVTRPMLYRPPTPIDRALAQVAAWAASPSVELLRETEHHLRILAGLLRSSSAAGPRVHDARIAAICIGHEVQELWTADRDFERFPIMIRNPVAG